MNPRHGSYRPNGVSHGGDARDGNGTTLGRTLAGNRAAAAAEAAGVSQGRPPAGGENRDALRGILFIARSGIGWQMLPTEVFKASGSSCWRRLRDWTRDGVWPEVHKRLLNRLGKADGVNLDRVVVDSQSVRALRGARTAAPTRPTAENAGASGT